MNNDFVINTESGDIWKFDDNSNIFKLIEKEQSEEDKKAEKFGLTLGLGKFSDFTHAVAETAHFSQRSDIQKAALEVETEWKKKLKKL